MSGLTLFVNVAEFVAEVRGAAVSFSQGFVDVNFHALEASIDGVAYVVDVGSRVVDGVAVDFCGPDLELLEFAE